MRDRGDDEREEWRRRELERARQSIYDTLYDNQPKTLAGDEDGRGKRKRKYRVFRAPLSMQLRTRAIVQAIIERDQHESLPALFEILIGIYQEKFGAIDANDIPPDDELVRRHLEERDSRDADDSDR